MLKLYTYDEIDERRANKGWLEEETVAYDRARADAQEYMLEHGEPDPEDTECPDDTIAEYFDHSGLWFLETGALINVMPWRDATLVIKNDMIEREVF